MRWKWEFYSDVPPQAHVVKDRIARFRLIPAFQVHLEPRLSRFGRTGKSVPKGQGVLIICLVVLVYSVNPSFPMLLLGPGSFLLDRYQEGLSLLKPQALEVRPWYDYSQIVAFVDHFDL